MTAEMCSMEGRMERASTRGHGQTAVIWTQGGRHGIPAPAYRRTTMHWKTRSVLEDQASRACADAETGDKRAAARYGVSRRTVNRWRHEGPLPLRAMQGFLFAATDPMRYATELMVTAEHRQIEVLDRTGLIAYYRELLAEDSAVEGEDNAHRIRRSVDWLARAEVSQKDATIDVKKAACERRFAVLGVTEAEVFGGGS